MRELLLVGRGQMDFIPELAVASGELASRLVGELNRDRPAGTEPYAIAGGLPLLSSLEEVEVYDHVVYLNAEDGSYLYRAGEGRVWGLPGSAAVEVTEEGGRLWGVQGPRESVERWAAARRLALRDDSRLAPPELEHREFRQVRSA